ncbi:polyprotein [Plakobranchus ocellatus]|uniref:Polyprotein n=1 Tax=Plakobranchus ocellatus TaxID=259542 RepID=A0AAV4BF68_9GAST|nr:polyprotein [Plakobranchus ocellatus]
MERKGVIKKVQVPTEWVKGLVIVEKQDSKDIRLCLDPRNLNKAIKREHHPLPTNEEITTRLTGAKEFSKLEANSGYWQIPLDEDSQLLTTFNTPQGRYCFTRMPFGITSAQEVFHKRIHEAFEDVVGVETDIDDILVWGKIQRSMMNDIEKSSTDVARSN